MKETIEMETAFTNKLDLTLGTIFQLTGRHFLAKNVKFHLTRH